ncbi:MAG TPA: putative metal-binding motif-containing protein, partial [Polyangiaceae bacterium]|nr:putative metal-binding motif-containing protein [Polyangiaceae bacterium]
MNRSARLCPAITAIGAPARALLLAAVLGGALSCTDGDASHGPPGSGQAGGLSAGAAGADDSAGPGGAEQAAGEGGVEPAGGKGGLGGSSGHAGAPNPPPEFCTQDSDCDDGLYCNGVELCKSRFPGADAKVCMRPEFGPCPGTACDEAARECDCSHPDQDDDGYYVAGCTQGVSDCDETDGSRSPALAEVCDPQQPLHDEDCNDSTYVGTQNENGHRNGDVDGDGFFDEACANKLRYQPLFPSSGTPLTEGGSDCADGDPLVHPGAEELCDNKDNNCNGKTDEISGAAGENHTFYLDQDDDSWGRDDDPLI